MSQIVRQSNLFSAEDFTKIYKSFQDLNFTAYDYDTIKAAMVEYIKIHYPEDFNDYVESSEFIAIIELLAFLGTTLAFRVDLNSRENILDTAERRESIIRLARYINYQPKRNLAANGLFKILTVQTDQPLVDSAGLSLQNVPVNWSDPNDLNWFDRFLIVLNSAFNPTNYFGRPSKSGIVGNIPTDLYELNNVLGLNVAYNVRININGEFIPIDIVNPDFELTFFERHPDQNEPFNLIYRNDSLGVNSDNTGFFLYFRQGEIDRQDDLYAFAEPNRVTEYDDENVNQDDVYVQEIDDDGNVVTKWKRVPSVAGTNVIYNDIQNDERNIFEVISGNNDTISIKFPDGNFGNIPTGTFRTWFRTSIGRNITIRPDDAQSIQVTIPYNSPDELEYNLTLTFSLLETIANSEPAETNEDIKNRAPQLYYTQERMINNEDYNVFPLTFGNQIKKLRSTNRTHSGHSRYIDIYDPTGFTNNLQIIADDGALFRDEENQRYDVAVGEEIIGSLSLEVLSQLQNFIRNTELETFFYNDYLTEFTDEDLFGRDYFILIKSDAADEQNYWKTSPDKAKNDTGYFIKYNQADWPEQISNTDVNPNELVQDQDVWNRLWPLGVSLGSEYTNVITLNETPYKFVDDGASLTMVNNAQTVDYDESVTVRNVENFGQPFNPSVTDLGPVRISSEITDIWQALKVNPNFRRVFTESEEAEIVERLEARDDFGLGYDLDNDVWYVINGVNGNEVFELTEDTSTPTQIDIDKSNTNSWLVFLKYSVSSGEAIASYEIITRGTIIVFESLKQVRFFWADEDESYDSTTGRGTNDKISILKDVNQVSVDVFDVLEEDERPLERDSVWGIYDVFIYSDGYQDPSKVKVIPADLNEDGTSDDPNAFSLLVEPSDYVVFEKYIDFDGYQKERVWATGWIDAIYDAERDGDESGNPNNVTYYTDSSTGEAVPIVDVERGTIAGIPITEGNLIHLESETQLYGVVNQLNVYLNNVGTNESTKQYVLNLQGKSFRIRDDDSGEELKVGYPGKYQVIYIRLGQTGERVDSIEDTNHYEKNGRSFDLDTNISEEDRDEFYFRWDHFAPASQRIDPSVTNVIDITVLTNDYYHEVIVWKESRGDLKSFPPPPSTESLRTQFNQLEIYKSISDQLIYSTGKFKLLFGPQAEPELQATFKAVKTPSAIISDNELKTQIIQAIDEYFDVDNWDFGERFYYTELAAYIHTKLSKFLSTVVIVPDKEDSEFGDLFEIVANPDELFLSTATVADVVIVSNLTETNLRQ